MNNKNPELFQGEKYLNKNKNYFEGWYFKHTSDKFNISFIPGISINKKIKKAFIQIITDNSSYNINYDIKDFTHSNNPFYIKIANNYFSKEIIHIDIKDKKQNLKIFGDIKYTNTENIKSTKISPNIMGPFSHISFMECNHAILCMKSTINGIIKINNKKHIFKDNHGYIEKDWGTSFSKQYTWIQGNEFNKENVSFMLSIANIPFKLINFTGLICVLIIDEKEYRFATYNNTKIIKHEINNNKLNIVLQKNKYLLSITSEYKEGLKLKAPIKGQMSKDIYESISENIKVTLRENNKIIFSDTSKHCGLEIVK